MNSMHYTEFRSRVYEIVDKALEMQNDPIVDSIHIQLEDDIDNLMTDFLESVHE